MCCKITMAGKQRNAEPAGEGLGPGTMFVRVHIICARPCTPPRPNLGMRLARRERRELVLPTVDLLKQICRADRDDDEVLVHPGSNSRGRRRCGFQRQVQVDGGRAIAVAADAEGERRLGEHEQPGVRVVWPVDRLDTAGGGRRPSSREAGPRRRARRRPYRAGQAGGAVRPGCATGRRDREPGRCGARSSSRVWGIRRLSGHPDHDHARVSNNGQVDRFDHGKLQRHVLSVGTPPRGARGLHD